MRIGLRTKVVVLSSFLLLLPWLGHQYVAEMENFLRLGQEKNLVATSRALATALHDRPKLFDSQASFLESVEKGRDLYAYNIVGPIQLDGKLQDWQPYLPLVWHYGDAYLTQDNAMHSDEDISFKHMVGKYKDYLYAQFSVTDDDVVMRGRNTISLERNDHLKIAFTNLEGEVKTYLISTKQAGWVNAFDAETKMPFTQIQGYFRLTKQGYNIELRLPLTLLGNKLGFAILDKDQGEEELAEIATSNLNEQQSLGSILVPSPEIEEIIKGMARAGSRVFVVDQHRRVLADAGNIKSADGGWGDTIKKRKPSRWEQFEEEYLHPIYYKILTRPATEFTDITRDVAALDGSHINAALDGHAKSTWRLTPDQKAVILSAAYPIWIDDQVMGAVIAEETTNGIREIRNKAFEKLFNVILAIMLIGTLSLFLFASIISTRIRRLRDAAEKAIDAQGRVTGKIDKQFSSDEIGDLSRSFASIVNRLGGYTHYLENMSSRLSHELRTPVAVVRSSLESLELQNTHEPSQKYIARAKEGVARLNKILTTMSEATRLEYAIENSQKEQFNLSEVINGCMQGYTLAYPNKHFNLALSDEAYALNGVPEFIAQLLDKLISNAVDFAEKETSIEVNYHITSGKAQFSIFNAGPLLPPDMANHIFDSMVSVRESSKQKEPHLGLGLYMARLICDFHGATITATNKNQGVEFLVTFKG